ncbi:DUF2934 domain-containing protein [Mesorhizobium sp. B3-1-9]|uniref:DUF2934 domain-containing protein n=1 Tax=unclassified Mesorhizobium TaxID=325217 RepID=UPI00112D1C94|nr:MULTISPECIES: DUF2934 domain-containing protein [unclassified Mesorhizobium]TPI36042.1 DUF2934 domain-containing protein [Mesorhizobium sp. B3-1-6]TPI41987.1 DUF2934 domain-containing protein [Mesorhizobium sp. B3-1-9]TPI55873.1 DUF2934 domain-containing protein [Mesorhizobium sp. B3-1-7]TPI70752.1 DUF2934 domain-containing protein [Mesorhizobium sp. B3-1-8]TPI74491.1 DUF2934 domain-containing protein [Mesorhizobium sp. B3-1-3]
MTDDRHERIRQRAHEIWEQAGRPEGAHMEHWDQATAEIDEAGRPKKAAKKAAAAKVEKPKAAKAEKPAKAPKAPPKSKAKG